MVSRFFLTVVSSSSASVGPWRCAQRTRNIVRKIFAIKRWVSMPSGSPPLPTSPASPLHHPPPTQRKTISFIFHCWKRLLRLAFACSSTIFFNVSCFLKNYLENGKTRSLHKSQSNEKNIWKKRLQFNVEYQCRVDPHPFPTHPLHPPSYQVRPSKTFRKIRNFARQRSTGLFMQTTDLLS